MDWDDLRIFLAVARTESLSAAGRGLKIDPATVGRRVARLEDAIGAPLSPYAVTKLANELYASVFARCYGIEQEPAYVDVVVRRWEQFTGEQAVLGGPGGD